jgi:hypothetical protein
LQCLTHGECTTDSAPICAPNNVCSHCIWAPDRDEACRQRYTNRPFCNYWSPEPHYGSCAACIDSTQCSGDMICNSAGDCVDP